MPLVVYVYLIALEMIHKVLFEVFAKDIKSKDEDCYGSCKKFARNTEYSKYDNLRKFSRDGTREEMLGGGKNFQKY